MLKTKWISLRARKKNVKLYPKNIVGIIFYNSLLLGQFNKLQMQIHFWTPEMHLNYKEQYAYCYEKDVIII